MVKRQFSVVLKCGEGWEVAAGGHWHPDVPSQTLSDQSRWPAVLGAGLALMAKTDPSGARGGLWSLPGIWVLTWWLLPFSCVWWKPAKLAASVPLSSSAQKLLWLVMQDSREIRTVHWCIYASNSSWRVRLHRPGRALHLTSWTSGPRMWVSERLGSDSDPVLLLPEPQAFLSPCFPKPCPPVFPSPVWAVAFP